MFGELAEVVGGQWRLFPSLPGPELRAAARQAIGVPALTAGDVRVERTWTDGGLHGEELSWTVGFGPRTRAYLLRPRDHGGPLPGVVALHCHAGMKWAGKEKIADGPEGPSPEVRRLRRDVYGGRAFAGELARRGFAVLAHDVLTWGSRRFALDVPEGEGGLADRYDRAAARHEHVVAKHCALLGTSFAGVVAGEEGLSRLGDWPDLVAARAPAPS
ncbi:hypothetical protein ACNF49_50265 [Actinomadura sp. ATCC 39365]